MTGHTMGMSETVTLVSHPGSRARQGFGPKAVELVDMPADFIHDGNRYALDADGSLWRGTDIRDALGDVEVDGTEVRFDGDFDFGHSGCFPRPTRLAREADGTLLLWTLRDGYGAVVLQRHDHLVHGPISRNVTVNWMVQQVEPSELLRYSFPESTSDEDRYRRQTQPAIPTLDTLPRQRTSLTVAEAIKHGIVTASPGWDETRFDVRAMLDDAMRHVTRNVRDMADRARTLADLLDAVADGTATIPSQDVTRYGQPRPTRFLDINEASAKRLQRLRTTHGLWATNPAL